MLEYGTASQMTWHRLSEEVRHTVRSDGRRIYCRITREAIEDQFGTPPNESACLTAAQENFDLLTDKFGLLIAAERFEGDGSILIRKSDF